MPRSNGFVPFEKLSREERYVEVLADTGIHSKVPETDWQSIVDQLTSDIGEGRAGDGLVKAVNAVGDRLARLGGRTRAPFEGDFLGVTAPRPVLNPGTHLASQPLDWDRHTPSLNGF